MDMEQMLSDKKLQRAFDMFDVDASGYISAYELKEVLGLTGDNTMNEKIKQIIDQVDNNNDGNISYEEFKGMMTQLSKD